MLHFDCDYMAGAHPQVLDAIVRNNSLQTPGYGNDDFCREARELIRQACNASNAEVFFMAGGTQTNATVMDAILPVTKGVLAAETGHINVHEAGAIELSGHKVLGLPSHEGKIDSSELRGYLKDFYADETWKYMVAPGAVYISFPTEYGTIYSLKELSDIHSICGEYGIPLYVDGARLGYGLAASDDVTLASLAENCDVFYIGGTKMGALFGEAVVFPEGKSSSYLPDSFESIMKAHGSVVAKGRLLGIQFAELFRDGLYGRIGVHGVELAARLRRIFEEAGFDCFIDSLTNQQFFILPNEMIDRLGKHVSFELWGPRGDVESKVRFVTSWETTYEDIELMADIVRTC